MKMPRFYFREMRQSFVRLFGSVDNIKHIYLQEMYPQLTEDISAASCESEKDIDKTLMNVCSKPLIQRIQT